MLTHTTARTRHVLHAVFLGGEAPVEFFDFQTVLPRTLTKQFGTRTRPSAGETRAVVGGGQ